MTREDLLLLYSLYGEKLTGLKVSLTWSTFSTFLFQERRNGRSTCTIDRFYDGKIAQSRRNCTCILVRFVAEEDVRLLQLNVWFWLSEPQKCHFGHYPDLYLIIDNIRFI